MNTHVLFKYIADLIPQTAFNAALVVCASYIIYRSGKIPESAQIVPPERLRACVDDAAQTLESLDLENQTINTCAKYLRQLTAVLDILSKSI